MAAGARGLQHSGIPAQGQRRAELLGYDPRAYKLAAFTIGGALAGIGIGALLGGAIASSQYRYYAPPPPVVYAPPPPYYGGPVYAVPPGYRY
jgi:hypothetical protein